MTQWNLYRWNNHQYEWSWIGMVVGDTPQEAIRFAKQWLPAAVARGEVMKVERYNMERHNG